jgi:hypothetical protein
MKRHFLHAAIASSLAILCCSPSLAQSYPSKTVKIIVPGGQLRPLHGAAFARQLGAILRG